MSTRQAIRDWLSAQDGPKWGCEIIAGVRATGATCPPATLHAMHAEGQLLRTGDGPYEYTIGRAPRARKPDAAPRVKRTPEERAARRKEMETARLARRNEKRRAAKHKATGKPVIARGPRPRRSASFTVKAAIACQSVADFLANGGRVERLPGFTQTSGYLPRRPQMARGVQVAP